MEIRDKVVVVTGGARGIGAALARRFAQEGARAIVVADLDRAVDELAREIGGTAVVADVGLEIDVQRLVATALRSFGRIDLFCSNAGISAPAAFETTSDPEWQRTWQVNLMAHVYAARALLPPMLAAGGGYLLHTASAAGLLSQIGSAPYAVTKHAAVAFAEWLSITYWDRGIRVSCLCPQGVRTRMLDDASEPVRAMLAEEALEPAIVADAVVQGIGDERFLILPHPQVSEYFRRKADDYDRWLRGMRRLQQKMQSAAHATDAGS
jgi:NAD(P)-dependent dehydrogenase (short-subunit alcohol dehydrogenase family)